MYYLLKLTGYRVVLEKTSRTAVDNTGANTWSVRARIRWRSRAVGKCGEEEIKWRQSSEQRLFAMTLSEGEKMSNTFAIRYWRDDRHLCANFVVRLYARGYRSKMGPTHFAERFEGMFSHGGRTLSRRNKTARNISASGEVTHSHISVAASHN